MTETILPYNREGLTLSETEKMFAFGKLASRFRSAEAKAEAFALK